MVDTAVLILVVIVSLESSVSLAYVLWSVIGVIPRSIIRRVKTQAAENSRSDYDIVQIDEYFTN